MFYCFQGGSRIEPSNDFTEVLYLPIVIHIYQNLSNHFQFNFGCVVHQY